MNYIIYISLLLLLIFFKGTFLAILSKILLVLLYPFNLITVLIKYVKQYQFKKVFDDFNFHDALETDIFLHRNYRTFWNITSSKGGTPFGRKNMTLSAMIGLKNIEGTLTGLLWVFYYILYAIDYKNWKNKGHCINAYYTYKNNN